MEKNSFIPKIIFIDELLVQVAVPDVSNVKHSG